MKKAIVIILILVICAGAFLVVSALKKNKFTGSDYTIPELDLSTMPEELKGTEYEYLYD